MRKMYLQGSKYTYVTFNCSYYDLDTLMWTNGDSVNYLNWNAGEPSDTDMSQGEDCVELYKTSSKWNDISCDRSNNYICMVPKGH